MSEAYTEIMIRIRAWDEEKGAYPVEASLGEGWPYQAELCLDREKLLTETLDAAAYGLDLFDVLFAGPIRRAYDKATGQAEATTQGRVRIRLWIDRDAAELHAIPWERLYHSHRGQELPLSISTLTPFSRYVDLEEAEASALAAWPLRLLFAVANPNNLKSRLNLAPIPVEEEVASLCAALGNLQGKPFQVTILPGQTGLSPALRQQLAEQGYEVVGGPTTPEPTTLDLILRHLPTHHVLHFLGHGAFVQDTERGEGTAVLYLEGEKGTAQRVKDTTLKAKLGALDTPPHLVFLAACDSAKRPEKTQNPFVGLAPKLIEAGVPAVVAMQDQVPMDVARSLTADFYRRLLDHGTVDRALNEARNVLFQPEQTDWAIPVLLMRLHDGRLVELPPLRRALETIRGQEQFAFYADDNPDYLQLPIEVIHLTGQQDYHLFTQQNMESVATIPVWQALQEVRKLPRIDEGGRPRPRLVVLMGGYGSNKTTQMERIVWLTAGEALEPQAARSLPLYLSLDQFPQARREWQNPVEEMIRSTLQSCSGLTPAEVHRLLTDESVTLCLLIDHSEMLTPKQCQEVDQELLWFMLTHPQHEYILAADPATFVAQPFGGLDLHILAIQPLERRRVRHFLIGLARQFPTAQDLLDRLDQDVLYDLAAIPWFLLHLVQHAKAGLLPESRTQFLQQMLDDAIADIAGGKGMRTRAEETLCALAWEMQTTRTPSLRIPEAFALMGRIRGNREYNLEELFEALIDARLLGREGMEGVRFAYDRIRAYCCAKAIVSQADRGRVLEDITASLGRLARLRWWEETMVFVCGLLAYNQAVLERLLEVIVYGVSLLESDQAFLAARCLAESKQTRQSSACLPESGQQTEPSPYLAALQEHVTAALAWRLSNQNESRPAYRCRAAQLLGQIVHPTTIDWLARVTYGKTRTDEQGRPDYDYSSVRMAAVIGLLRLTASAQHQLVEQILDQIDVSLSDMLHSWQAGEVDHLIPYLQQSENVGAQAVAAFALGDLYTRLSLGMDQQEEANKALQALTTTFFQPGSHEATLWAVTYALAIIDLPVVKAAVLVPFLEWKATLAANEEACSLYDKCVAYLIGLLRWQEDAAYQFLVEHCLLGTSEVKLASVAIQALGELADRRYKPLLEQIALGNFEQTLPLLAAAEPEDLAYLQRRTIEALATVGDLETVARLRAECRSRAPDISGLDPRLEEALYRTSEEIFWRVNWNRYL